MNPQVGDRVTVGGVELIRSRCNAVIVTFFAPPDYIHRALSLKPSPIPQGSNPEESKKQFIEWIDNQITSEFDINPVSGLSGEPLCGVYKLPSPRDEERLVKLLQSNQEWVAQIMEKGPLYSCGMLALYNGAGGVIQPLSVGPLNSPNNNW